MSFGCRIVEEDEELRRSFYTSSFLEDQEVETDINDIQEKLSMEQIRLRFIEDEQDDLASRISEVWFFA